MIGGNYMLFPKICWYRLKLLFLFFPDYHIQPQVPAAELETVSALTDVFFAMLKHAMVYDNV